MREGGRRVQGTPSSVAPDPSQSPSPAIPRVTQPVGAKTIQAQLKVLGSGGGGRDSVVMKSPPPNQ